MGRKKKRRDPREILKRRRGRHATEERVDPKSDHSDGKDLPEGYSTPIIKHFLIENPLASLSGEQRRDVAKRIGEGAERTFRRELDALISGIKRHDPTELLSTAAFHCLYINTGPDADFTDEGPYPQEVVEVIQSMSLRFDISEFGSTPVTFHHLFDILDRSKACSATFAHRRVGLAEGADQNAHLPTPNERGAR